MKVESIKKNSDKAVDWTLVECLKELVRKIESGDAPYTKGYLMLEYDDGRYGFRNAGLNAGEALLLIELSKQDLLQIVVD